MLSISKLVNIFAMPGEFSHRLDFEGKLHLPHHEGEEPPFEAGEAKAAEDERGREAFSADELLNSGQTEHRERTDPLAGNPYRAKIQDQLRQVDREGRPTQVEAWLDVLIGEYNSKLVAATRRAKENHRQGGPNAQALQEEVKHLDQAVDWLRGYKAAKFAEFKGVPYEVATKQDIKLLQKREQDMLKELSVLATSGNDCAAYIYQQCNQQHDALWQVINMSPDRMKAIRDMLLTTMIEDWLGSKQSLSHGQKLEYVHSVRFLVNSWFPPGSKTLR